MPEAIVALDSAMVGGQPYLCVAYLHDVMVLKVPPCNPTHQEQWIKQPYISHRSRFKISHVKLSLTIPGQVVVTTETGELCVHWDEGKEEVIVRGGVPKGEGAVADPLYLCGYGAHPCHVLWVRGGDLYSSDLRAKLPPLGSYSQKLVWTGASGRDISCMVSVSQQPFHILFGTSRYLVLVDLRNVGGDGGGSNPLLLVPHHLLSPPSLVSCLYVTKEQHFVVLLSSHEVSMVFCYQLKSECLAQLTTPPHTVCSVRDTLQCLKNSDLCALACSQALYRFTDFILGAALLPLSWNTYGGVVVTKLGDIFYQCWKYTTSSSASLNFERQMCKWQYHGLKLWLKESFLHTRDLNERCEVRFPHTVRDMTIVAAYLTSEGEQPPQCLKCYYQCVHSIPGSPSPGSCRRCDGGGGGGGVMETCLLDDLVRSCEHVVPKTKLDVALVTGWDNDVIKGLFQDDVESTTVGDKDLTLLDETLENTVLDTEIPNKRRMGF